MATRHMEVTEMDTVITSPTVVVSRVEPPATCYLCGMPLSNTNDCPLCSACEHEEDAQWRDYLAEREQTRQPL